MTYRELKHNEMGWIASHVAGDLLSMNTPTDEVSEHDMSLIQAARKADGNFAVTPSRAAESR